MKKLTITDYLGKEKTINSEAELISELTAPHCGEQVVVILYSENNDSLSVGVGRELGFVQHSDEGRTPPYLLARRPDTEVTQTDLDFVEFSQGGTLTPIPRNLCIPMSIVRDICVHYFNSGDLPEWVDWIPV